MAKRQTPQPAAPEGTAPSAATPAPSTRKTSGGKAPGKAAAKTGPVKASATKAGGAKTGGTKTSAAKQGGANPESTEQQIARRAYELFERRGGQHGYHHEDWLKAEREIRGSNTPQGRGTAGSETAAPSPGRAGSRKKTQRDEQ